MPLSMLATSASLGVTARMPLVTKEGDLVSVFVFLFLFTARMPLVTRIGDLDSVFVFGFVTARMPLVTRAGGSVSVNTLTIQEGVCVLVWQENTSLWSL